MKLQYSHTITAPTVQTGSGTRHTQITDTAIIAVSTVGREYHYIIVDIFAGLLGSGTIEEPYEFGTSWPTGDFALGRVGNAAILVSSAFACVIYPSGYTTPWRLIESVPDDDGTKVKFSEETGEFYIERTQNPLAPLGRPLAVATDSSGNAHVLTSGKGLVRAIFDSSGGLAEGWTIIDQPVWTGAGWQNDNFFGYIGLPPICVGDTVFWAVDANINQEPLSSTLVSIAGNTVSWGDQTPRVSGSKSSIGEWTGGGIRYIDTINRRTVEHSFSGIATAPISYGDSWSHLTTFNTACVRPGEKALLQAQVNSPTGPPVWGFGDTSGKFYGVASYATMSPGGGIMCDLGKHMILQAGATSWYVLAWKPTGGVISLRQRQTLTANTGSWPLRQRQNGGANGSWPLRQRQAA